MKTWVTKINQKESVAALIRIVSNSSVNIRRWSYYPIWASYWLIVFSARMLVNVIVVNNV